MAEALTATPTNAGPRGHVLALDGVRGTAVLAVLIYHCTVIKPLAWYEHWFCAVTDLGRFGVDLFFVLSGFLITTVLRSALRDERFFRNFYIRRALRIFPLYYALIVVGFLGSRWITAHSGERGVGGMSATDTSLWYLAYGTNFLVALRNAWPHGLLDVSWSLCIEEHFYMAWPLLVFATGKRTLQRLLLSIIVLSVIVRAMMWHWGFSSLQIYVLTFTRLDGLAFGSLLSLSLSGLATNGPRLQKKAWRGFLVSAAGVAALLVSGRTGFDSQAIALFGYTLISGMFALLLAAILLSPPNGKLTTLFERSWLRALGRYSYALYLVHMPIRSILRDRLPFGDTQFRTLREFAMLGQVAFYLVSVGVSLLVAWVSWNVLEKRFLALKDRLAPVARDPVNSDSLASVVTKAEEGATVTG
jgi:peptidoglycan/LPS O-acetylase OafA/YrhL